MLQDRSWQHPTPATSRRQSNWDQQNERPREGDDIERGHAEQDVRGCARREGGDGYVNRKSKAVTLSPSRSTTAMSSRSVAPRAPRRAISRRRCTTVFDSTPYRPVVASASESAENAVSTSVVNRGSDTAGRHPGAQRPSLAARPEGGARPGWDGPSKVSNATRVHVDKASSPNAGGVIGGEGGIRIDTPCEITNQRNESAPTEAIESIEFLDRRT
jgi:hypothetical protein